MSNPSSHDKPLPHAFGFNDDIEFEGGFTAKPLVELEMSRLSAELRRKPYWWTKFRDNEILTKWRAEALAQAEYMKESHVDYVLKELDGYANLRDEETGAEVSCYDRIWQSDKIVPAPLRERLIAGVAKLENIPESERDWHPRSNGQVLVLVHPSLYPIVYGRTLSYPEDSDERNAAELQVRLKPPTDGDLPSMWDGTASDYYISKRFQWLPTDFRVSDDGKSVKSDGYINNLHPIEHAELHRTIEELVAAYIPLFERALTDSIPDNHAVPERTTNEYGYTEKYTDGPKSADFLTYEEYEVKYREWEDNRQIVLPNVVAGGYQLGSLEKRETKYTLGGRAIQVIVKLANILLTPERPSYSGGSWHIEGMMNEHIAVSGIYYYDEQNITESRLAFRTAVQPPENYHQNDIRGCELTWGIGSEEPCVNELGSVITSQHRCIAFPNTYQHRVSPFELADKSKPGHRKIVALFLVDPAVRRPSTKTVPPQQKEWRASAIASNPTLKAAFDKLAPEILDRVDVMAEGVMTREEAKKYRLELMDERTDFVLKNDEKWFCSPFSLCEH